MIETGVYDADIAKYIRGTLELVFEGMVEDIDTKEQPAHISYIDMEKLEIHIMLTNNYYTNPNNMHICFPTKIKEATNNDANIDTDVITVNNFFAHLIKEINITKYGNDRQLMPRISPYEICQYSDAMLKHLTEKSLKKLPKTLLHSNEPVVYNKTNIDRTYNSTTLANFTDYNLDNRITLFQNQLKNELVYRVLLRYFTGIGKINFPLKIGFKIKCHLETDMKKLFESKKKVTAISAPDVKIIFTKATFIQFEQFLLDKNFRQYLKQ